MGKLAYSLILLFAIEMSLVLFAGAGFPGSSLYLLLTDPTQWDDNLLLGTSIINDILLILGGAAIVTGLYFVRNEWIVYAGLGAVFISFGINLYNLWQFYEGQGIFGDSGAIIATLLIGGIIIMFIITVLDFTRGRD